MTEKFNIKELRKAACDRPDPVEEPEGYVPMTGDLALALVEAVEAALVVWDNERPLASQDGWWVDLERALARFDFGETR